MRALLAAPLRAQTAARAVPGEPVVGFMACATDAATDTGFVGTIEFTIVDETSSVLCATTIELTGTSYAGGCPDCDFEFAVSAKVTSEKGKCPDYADYWPKYTFLPSADYPALYLGYQPPDKVGYYYMWYGYPDKKGGLNWWRMAGGGPDGGYWEGDVAFAKPELEWSLHDFYRDYKYDPLADIDYYCKLYEGYEHGKGFTATGAYTATSSIDCFTRHYDLWSFIAAETGYTDVSVDTVSASTSFSPVIILMDDATCELGRGEDSYACTYPPKNYECPAFALSTVKGALYNVLVRAWGDCSDPIGEYEITIDTIADPSLTLVNANVPFYEGESVTSIGTANIP